MNKLAVAALLLVVGCGKKDPIGGGAGCVGDFLPGDLAVSEIFANPAGDDGGKEWFEIYNAGSEAADLAGLTLLTSKNDGSGEKKHRVTAATLASGGYFVLGGVPSTALPSFVDYGYGDDLGDLRNTGGRIALLCGSVVVDEVTYATVPEDASRAFSGALTPDAVANDQEAMWCEADLTPGAKNPSCTPIGETSCLDGETERPRVVPQPGDLAISEWMPNPKVASDSLGEWFEVTVLRDVDLNGVEIGTDSDSTGEILADAACLRRTAGSRVLFARNDLPAMNGGLPAVDFTFRLTLGNSDASIFVRAGGVVLDEVSYATTGDGVSTQVDAAGNVCPSTATIGTAGDKGTPGAPNGTCGVVGGEQCNDGGVPRDLVAPAVGDLVITEFMANPSTDDPVGEWFEVYVAHAVDLNGLQVGSELASLSPALSSSDCIAAAAGSYLIFARAPNAALPRIDHPITFSIVNSNRGIVLARDGALLDGISYTATMEGVATSLSSTRLSPADNDTTANWCPAVATYGGGIDKGSPGAANPVCPGL